MKREGKNKEQFNKLIKEKQFYNLRCNIVTKFIKSPFNVFPKGDLK